MTEGGKAAMARPATGTIEERPGKDGTSWRLRFRAFGQKQSITLRASEGWTRQRAEQELENVMADVRRGLWRPPEREPSAEAAPREVPTFHVFASEWFEDHRHGLRGRTAEDYQWTLTHHLLPFFADFGLAQITTREVDRYRTWQLGRKVLCPTTINKTLTRLAQILELAVEYDYLPANPARGRRRRAKAQAPRRQWLEPEQVRPLIDAGSVRGQRNGNTSPDPRTRAMLSVLICAGLRIGEALSLRWRDVDLAGGRLMIREAKTDAGVRTVRLWPELREEFITFKLAAPDTAAASFVFGTATGEQDTRQNVRKRLHRAIERANATTGAPMIPEDLRLHDLRRTFCALLYARGESPPYVMDQMGHSDPKLALAIYAKAIGSERDRGHSMRLTAVIRGAEWEPTTAAVPPARPVLHAVEDVA